MTCGQVQRLEALTLCVAQNRGITASIMTTERSDRLFESTMASQQKFDYFVLGVVGALCAFIGQAFNPGQLGYNPSTMQLVSLLTLVASAVAGFRRIESCNLLMQINSKYLRMQEQRGVLSANVGSPLINHSTGEVHSPQQVAMEIAVLNQAIPLAQEQMEKVGKRVEWAYFLRNWLLLVGFLMLLASKVWSAYV